MTYDLLDELLATNFSSRIVELEALRPDSLPYTVLLQQPCGVVEATAGFIGNNDHSAACAKHQKFLNLAHDISVDLAVTPEYSCPWDVVEEALQRRCLPERGKLWVLGCESITPDALNAMIAKYPEVVWVCEDVHPQPARTFLDPVCYILNALDGHGHIVPVIAVQFKTQHMVDHCGYLERDHLIMGSRRYILRNSADSVHLTALVCSEALTFTLAELETRARASYILLHPQLNAKPYHPTFAKYRDDAFQWGAEDHEVLCANWARTFRITVGGEPSAFGASALFTKSTQLNLQDDSVNANHHLGLYYSRWDTHRSHIFLFNYSESVFHFQVTKPSQIAHPAALRKRTGPAMLGAYAWDERNANWVATESLPDGFSSLCDDIKADLSPLRDATMPPVDKERLLALTNGAISASTDWHSVLQLPCFSARQDQRLRRMTVVQDPADEEFGELHDERYRRVHNYSYLRNSILTQPDLIPACINDLIGDWSISYPLRPRQYNTNVSASDGRNPATVIFLGVASAKKAKTVFDTMADILGDAQRRLVIWYQQGETIEVFDPPRPRFDDNLTESHRSIAREE